MSAKRFLAVAMLLLSCNKASSASRAPGASPRPHANDEAPVVSHFCPSREGSPPSASPMVVALDRYADVMWVASTDPQTREAQVNRIFHLGGPPGVWHLSGKMSFSADSRNFKFESTSSHPLLMRLTLEAQFSPGKSSAMGTVSETLSDLDPPQASTDPVLVIVDRTNDFFVDLESMYACTQQAFAQARVGTGEQ
jgi:hypothetical protein